MMFMVVGWGVLLCAAVVLAVPCAVLAVQVFTASLPRRAGSLVADDAARPPLAVIVPAHNESDAVRRTLDSLRPQLQPGDRLLVVADNCSDDTAFHARNGGAEVSERHDTSRRGKGYALDHGWQLLSTDTRWQLLLCVDADCIVHPGAVQALAQQAVASGRPVQSRYLIVDEHGGGVRERLSSFAYVLINWVRPLGSRRLGLGCQLVGSGMMFPRAVLAGTSLASGHLVEDLQLGLSLAARGHAPVFCEAAFVSSAFPAERGAQETQRTRWEHGRLSIITRLLPPLLWQALRSANGRLLAMVLDAAVPPLTLLLPLQAMVAMVALVFAVLTGAAAPLAVSAGALAALVAALLLAWYRFGRALVRGTDLLGAPRYLLWKLPLLARYLGHRQTAWVRTQRSTPHDAGQR